MADIEFKYQEKDNLYTGEVWFPKGAKRSCLHFKDAAWSEALRCLASVIKVIPDCSVEVSRLDTPHVKPIQVPQQEVELFRNDPAAGIRSWTIDPIIIDTKKTFVGLQPLPIGYEEKTDFFCENLFLRVRWDKQLVEDVVTGQWLPFVACDDHHTYKAGGQHTLQLLYISEHNDWAEVPVEYVMHLPYERFFLPRSWNVSGPWATKEELAQKLLELKHAKETIK